MDSNQLAHKHPRPEKTYRDFVENVVASYIHREDVCRPYPDIKTQQQLVDTIVQVAECPICTSSIRLAPSGGGGTVLFKKLQQGAKCPEKAHSDDAGFDLYALYTTDLLPGQLVEVATGVALEIPESLYATVDGKSSFGSKGVHTFRGIIDAGYRGHISVYMRNDSLERITIQRYQKFAQLIFHYQIPIQFVSTNELSPSARGEGRLGSTGKF